MTKFWAPTYETELFMITVNNWKLSTIATKRSIPDVLVFASGAYSQLMKVVLGET